MTVPFSHKKKTKANNSKDSIPSSFRCPPGAKQDGRIAKERPSTVRPYLSKEFKKAETSESGLPVGREKRIASKTRFLVPRSNRISENHIAAFSGGKNDGQIGNNTPSFKKRQGQF
jgi:hypothetical protein